jgi:hypothetical protein
MASNDSRSVFECAIDVSQDIAKLSTALAHAGADPVSLSPLTRIAGMFSDMAHILGSPDGFAATGHLSVERKPSDLRPAVHVVSAPAPAGVLPGARATSLDQAADQLAAMLGHVEQRDDDVVTLIAHELNRKAGR